MRASRALVYGGIPVPWTVSWSGEEPLFVARCAYAGGPAICQVDAPGRGKPQFGKPHSNRQRQAISQGLCDLCGAPLALRTKVSFSHARAVLHAASIGDILQVEPLLHRECAAVSVRHCPSLKRDLRDGSAVVRQVSRYRVQMAIMSAEYVRATTGDNCKAVGHAKVQLLAWTDRTSGWLGDQP